MGKTAIILLYGLYSPDRQAYTRYLENITDDIKKNDIARVILCGGFTDPKKPGVSEAGSVKAFLERAGFKKEIVLEDRSITTNQNLELAAQMIEPGEEVIVYGETARYAKIIWLSLHFLLGLRKQEIYKLVLDFYKGRELEADFKYSNLTVKNVGCGSQAEDVFGQTFASILDVLAVYDRELGDLDLESRKKELGLTS